MDPKHESYQKDIRDYLCKIYEAQERQLQQQTCLTQQIESVKFYILSHDQRLQSLEVSSLTMPKTVYRPDVREIESLPEPGWSEMSQPSSASQTEHNLCDMTTQTLHDLRETSASHIDLNVIDMSTSQNDRSLRDMSTSMSDLNEMSISQTEHSLREISNSQSGHGLHEMSNSQSGHSLREMSNSQIEHGLPDKRIFLRANSTNDSFLSEMKTHLSAQTRSVNALLEEERYFLRDQLKEAQDEILHRLSGFEQQFISLHQGLAELRSLHLSDGNKEPLIQAAFSAKPAKSCYGEQELKSELETVCRELESSLRAVTQAELVWLDNEVKAKLGSFEEQLHTELAGMGCKIDGLDKKWSRDLADKMDGLCKIQREQLENKIDGWNKTLPDDLELRVSSMNKRYNEELMIKIDLQSKKQSDELIMKIDGQDKKQSEELIMKIDGQNKKQWEELIMKIDGQNKNLCKDLENKGHSVNKKTEELLIQIEAEYKRQNEDFKTKMRDLNHKLREELAVKMDEMSKKQRDELDSKTVSLRLALTNKTREAVKEITENFTRLSQQQQDYVGRAIAELKTSIKSSNNELPPPVTKAINDSSSQLAERQRSHLEKCVKDGLVSSTREIKDEMRKSCDEIKRAQELELRSTATTLTADIVRRCTDVVKNCQRNTEDKVETKHIQLLKKLKRSEKEVCDFTEKECQLVRDGLRWGTSSRTQYTFDFYLEDFRSLIRSGEEVFSHSWHIDQLKSPVRGQVYFLEGGDLDVWLLYGRHPREVGLEPHSGVRLKITAVVTDLSNTIANHHVGQQTSDWNESKIPSNTNYGSRIGTVSCQRLLDLGFAAREQLYIRGAILVRYQLDVL